MANYSRLVGPSVVLAYAVRKPIEADTKPKLAIAKMQLVHKLLEKHVH